MMQRIYRHKTVSRLTLDEIQKIIKENELEYCGDYGLENGRETRLIFSMN